MRFEYHIGKPGKMALAQIAHNLAPQYLPDLYRCFPGRSLAEIVEEIAATFLGADFISGITVTQNHKAVGVLIAAAPDTLEGRLLLGGFGAPIFRRAVPYLVNLIAIERARLRRNDWKQAVTNVDPEWTAARRFLKKLGGVESAPNDDNTMLVTFNV